jgi:hypothetical protein
MKQYWQWEHEALERLGFSGTNGIADRERAVSVVVELLKQLQEKDKK